MNDTETTVATFKEIVKKMIDERDWNQFHSPKNLAMKISIEANELMEHFAWANTQDVYESLSVEKRQAIEDELADVIIVATAFANACNIDIAAAFERKIEEVKKKYPIDKSYGKSLKYNQL